MIRETAYDEVYDTQRHFRDILDAMARPGKIVTLERAEIHPPAELSPAAAYVCLSLLNGDVSVYVDDENLEVEQYIRVNTGCLSTTIDEADFLLVNGSEEPVCVEDAKEGLLTYPETAATLIVSVAAIASERFEGAVGLELSGPGVRDRVAVYIAGLHPDWADALTEKNAEFPLGVDTIFVTGGARSEAQVCGVPRSAAVRQV